MSSFPLHLLDGLQRDSLELVDRQHLFTIGDPVRSLFLVRQGEVNLIRPIHDGRELVMCRYGADTMVAEGSLFSDRYHCDAVSAGTSHVYRFDRDSVQNRITTDPEAIRAWSRYLTQGLLAARTRAEILSLKTVQERLDAWFSLRSETSTLSPSWKSVAGEIGVSPEALYRERARRRVKGNT